MHIGQTNSTFFKKCHPQHTEDGLQELQVKGVTSGTPAMLIDAMNTHTAKGLIEGVVISNLGEGLIP